MNAFTIHLDHRMEDDIAAARAEAEVICREALADGRFTQPDADWFLATHERHMSECREQAKTLRANPIPMTISVSAGPFAESTAVAHLRPAPDCPCGAEAGHVPGGILCRRKP